jgi:hypothetical protein
MSSFLKWIGIPRYLNGNAPIGYCASKDFLVIVLMIFRFPEAEKFAFVEVYLEAGELFK